MAGEQRVSGVVRPWCVVPVLSRINPDTPLPWEKDEDQAPEAAWKALVQEVVSELDSGYDLTPTTHRALVTVRELLFAHHPDLDEARSKGMMCVACWDTWPCSVYQVIEKGMRRGE